MPIEPPASAPGCIDFELADLHDARQVLDGVPPGIREMGLIIPRAYWEQRRRRLVPSDRALTGTAIDWVVALPAEVRPLALCDKFPCLANQIAESWCDHARTAQALGRLLLDERGGRQGFPSDVQREICMLHEHAQKLAGWR
jgi:hypothetical protein